MHTERRIWSTHNYYYDIITAQSRKANYQSGDLNYLFKKHGTRNAHNR